MNVDHILATLNRHEVRYLLAGGMNFLLRHEPVLTYDVDLWIEGSAGNLRACEAALSALEAEWGRTEDDWQPVSKRKPGWLGKQEVYCLTSPHGAIDIFLHLKGLADWNHSAGRAVSGKTAAGVAYRGLCDEDMLESEEALDEGAQRPDRIRVLREAVQAGRSHESQGS
jgi:hypothetical protein